MFDFVCNISNLMAIQGLTQEVFTQLGIWENNGFLYFIKLPEHIRLVMLLFSRKKKSLPAFFIYIINEEKIHLIQAYSELPNKRVDQNKRVSTEDIFHFISSVPNRGYRELLDGRLRGQIVTI